MGVKQAAELQYWREFDWEPHYEERFDMYYGPFFENFEILQGAGKVLDVGCGMVPIFYAFSKKPDRYPAIPEQHCCDPLIDAYLTLEKAHVFDGVEHLHAVPIQKVRSRQFDGAVMLNVLDHDWAWEAALYSCIHLLKPGGALLLWVDLRNVYRRDHLALNEKRLMRILDANFEMQKEMGDLETQNRHWSGIYKTYRCIAVRKSTLSLGQRLLGWLHRSLWPVIGLVRQVTTRYHPRRVWGHVKQVLLSTTE